MTTFNKLRVPATYLVQHTIKSTEYGGNGSAYPMHCGCVCHWYIMAKFLQ